MLPSCLTLPHIAALLSFIPLCCALFCLNMLCTAYFCPDLPLLLSSVQIWLYFSLSCSNSQYSALVSSDLPLPLQTLTLHYTAALLRPPLKHECHNSSKVGLPPSWKHCIRAGGYWWTTLAEGRAADPILETWGHQPLLTTHRVSWEMAFLKGESSKGNVNLPKHVAIIRRQDP